MKSKRKCLESNCNPSTLLVTLIKMAMFLSIKSKTLLSILELIYYGMILIEHTKGLRSHSKSTTLFWKNRGNLNKKITKSMKSLIRLLSLQDRIQWMSLQMEVLSLLETNTMFCKRKSNNS